MNSSNLPNGNELKGFINKTAPIGLLGFGITLSLFGLTNLNIIKMDILILTIGIFYGVVGQIIAAVIELKKKNLFASTLYTMYSLFWLTLAGVELMSEYKIGLVPQEITYGVYYTIWGMFTTGIFIQTLEMSTKTKQFFGGLSIMFILLMIGSFMRMGILIYAGGFIGLLFSIFIIIIGLRRMLNRVRYNNFDFEKEEGFSTIELEEVLTKNDDINEYRKAYYEFKKLDLEPIRKLVNIVSSDKFVKEVKNGDEIRKETLKIITSFVTKRAKLVKRAPEPQNLNSKEDVKSLIIALESVTLAAKTILIDRVARINAIINSRKLGF
jgi:succinate-acetate transporter protein